MRFINSDEYVRIYKEAALAYFKVLSQNLYGETEENQISM
jgi:hypothetical protein